MLLKYKFVWVVLFHQFAILMVKLFPQFLGEPQLLPPETQRLQAYRGRGLGRKLLEVVEEFSRTARRIFVFFNIMG